MHHLVCPQTMGGAHQGAGYPHPARCGAASPQVHKCRHTRCTEGWRVGKSSPITHNGAKATKPHDQAKGWRVGKKSPKQPGCHSTNIPAQQAPPAQKPHAKNQLPTASRRAEQIPAQRSHTHAPQARHRAHLFTSLYDLQHIQAKDRAMTEDAEIVPGHN